MIEKKNFYINGKWIAPNRPKDISVINWSINWKSPFNFQFATKNEEKLSNFIIIIFPYRNYYYRSNLNYV